MKSKSKLPTVEHIFLTKQEASKRSAVIKNLSYTLYLNLTAKSSMGKFPL